MATTTQAPPTGWSPQRRKRSWWSMRPMWQKVGLIAVAAILLCSIGQAFNGGGTTPTPPPVQPVASQPEGTATSGEAPVAPEPVTITGNGNAVVQIGAILNGKFTVAYTASYDFLIVDFMKADGSDGLAGFNMGLNEYGEGGVSGTRVFEFVDVTMVQASNTRGEWSLTFTPL